MSFKLPGWLTFIVNTVKAVSRKLKETKVAVFSAQAAYFLLFSSIPLLMLFLNIMRYVVPADELSMISYFVDMMPYTIRELARKVLHELLYTSSVPVISITSLLLLWSASRGLRSIAQGIRSMYSSINAANDKGYIYYSFVSVIYTLMLIVLMAAAFAIVLFGKYIEQLLSGLFKFPEIMLKGVFSIRNLVFLIFITLLLMLMYNRFSEKAMRFKFHFFGALTCAVGWLVFSYGYSVYIENFSNYSYIYGGLAAILLLMLWVYMCMYIMLGGALINVKLYEIKFKNSDKISLRDFLLGENRK